MGRRGGVLNLYFIKQWISSTFIFFCFSKNLLRSEDRIISFISFLFCFSMNCFYCQFLHFAKIKSTSYRHLQFNIPTFIRLLADFIIIFGKVKLSIFSTIQYMHYFHIREMYTFKQVRYIFSVTVKNDHVRLTKVMLKILNLIHAEVWCFVPFPNLFEGGGITPIPCSMEHTFECSVFEDFLEIYTDMSPIPLSLLNYLIFRMLIFPFKCDIFWQIS